jgi:hypothetical protein
MIQRRLVAPATFADRLPKKNKACRDSVPNLCEFTPNPLVSRPRQVPLKESCHQAGTSQQHRRFRPANPADDGFPAVTFPKSCALANLDLNRM